VHSWRIVHKCGLHIKDTGTGVGTLKIGIGKYHQERGLEVRIENQQTG